MSRAVLGRNPAQRVDPFAVTLESVDPAQMLASGVGPGKLGRTAEGLQKLRDEARTEGLALGRAEGFEAGRSEGRELGYEELRARFDEFRDALDESAKGVDAAMASWYERSEQALSELAVLIAARVVAQEIQTQPGIVAAIVKEALAEVTHSESVRIRLNPFDVGIVREHQHELYSASPSVRRVEIVDDPTLEAGCVIESEGGLVDASLRTKLEAVLIALRGQE